MAETQTCKQVLEITAPVSDVESETEKVIESLKKRARIPGFRPGKAPSEIIRRRFQEDIRQEVLEKLLPKHFWKRAEEEGLAVVGKPVITEVHFEKGEPLRFKAEFEVAPTFELKEYKDLEVEYADPEVTEDEVNQRIEILRDQKAQYVNLDPRPAAAGDHAVVSLVSVAGVDPPVSQDEVTLHIGGEDTFPEFTENLTGVSPGEEKEFDVTYPAEYAQVRLAGKTVRFRARLKGLRRKELPELTDEFAQEVGDFQTVDEFRDAVRKGTLAEKQIVAGETAKQKLVEKLVEMHDFPVPDAFIDQQIETQVARKIQALAVEGVDPRSLNLDWERVKEVERDRAIREVKASLLIHRIADAESIHATNEEVDRDVQRLAKQERQPVAAVRMRLEKEDGLRRIANRIRTEKTLNFVFEHARKAAPR